MPKVSVIIPVYNAESYLGECLDSVLGQTLKDIEAVCVDDGSTDGSAKILAGYAAKDSRVKVLTQRNSGAGAARNAGIDAAGGMFLAFMDPDDFYPAPEALEKLFDAATGSGCKISGGRLRTTSSHPDVAMRIQRTWDLAGRFPPCGKVRYEAFQAPWGFTCYLYDREMVCGNRIRFPEFRRFQDPPFFVQAMVAAKTFYAIPDCVYCYRVGEKAVDWNADGGKLNAERMRGYQATLELAERHSLDRLADLMLRWIGRRKVDFYGRMMSRLCGVAAMAAMPPSEPEEQDFFDGFKQSQGFDDGLFVLLRRIFMSPSRMRKPLEGVVSERLLLARHRGHTGFSSLSRRRKLLLSYLMAKGALRRRLRWPRDLASRLAMSFARPSVELLECAPPVVANSDRSATVIVPVYNGYEHLQRLCATLFDHTSPANRILFVDDASPDSRIAPYLASLAASHPNVAVLANEENLGFPETVNRGAARCDGDFVLLNSDTEVPAGWIERLFAPIWSCDNVASAMPLTCVFPKSGVHNPGVISMQALERMGLDAADRAIARIKVNPRFNVSQTNLGFCLAVSRAAWTKVGPFASDIFGFGYHEEADWCARARYRFGYEHRIVPNLLVAHWHNGSFSDERKRRQLERNRERLCSRNPMRNFDADARCRISRKLIDRAAAMALGRCDDGE